MPVDQYRVVIQKESYKFSASHFTVFGPRQAERLHGHNYAVSVECAVKALDELGMAFEFNSLKPHIKNAANLWDEFVLLPMLNPYIQFESDLIEGQPHTVVNFAGKSYRFPDSDLIKLPVRNVTSEELAKTFLQILLESWMSSLNKVDAEVLKANMLWMEVAIEETCGQRAVFRREFK